jgi:hypothetical protein
MKNLSPITLTSIELPGKILKFVTPLTLHPKRDASDAYLIIEDEEYELFIYARSRDSLKKELIGEITLLWETYAVNSDIKLTARAEKLRQILLANIKEVVRLRGKVAE